LIVLAVAVAFRRGEVAILAVVVVFGRRWRRFDRSFVFRLGRFTLLADSAHDVPF
jgi:hypothetical protein